MKKSRTFIVTGLILLVIVALVAAFGTYAVNRLLHLDTYKTQIIDELQKALNRPVVYATGEFTLRRGPAFSFRQVVIKEKDGASDFLAAERIDFKLSLLHLFEKKVVLKEISLKSPTVSLVRYKDGSFNISDLLETKKEESISPGIRDIWLDNGTIRLTDQAVSPQPLTLVMNNTDLYLDHLRRGRKAKFKLTTDLTENNRKTPLTFGGTVRLPKEGQPWSTVDLNVKIIAKGLHPEFYWPYYRTYVPFEQVTGQFDLDIDLKGTPTAFTTAGEVRINGLRFSYPQVFHSVLTPKELNLSYSLERTPSAVMVKSLNLKVDALKVKGSCDILDINTKDPRIVAKATTAPFRLEEFRGYVPYGIIVKDTADFIEQHIIGGTYRLDEGRLEGRISEIANMGIGDNYKVLSIRGRVERGIMTFGSTVPLFSDIKGGLEMKGEDFILSGMTARFGSSPFSLEGRITELYAPKLPCTYPFTMTMKPNQPEIAWLMGRDWGKKLAFIGDSTLKLSGNGSTSGYGLSGEWDLGPAAYSYPDFIRKPAGRPNSLSFQGVIGKDEVKLTSLRYNLAPLACSLSADYLYGKKQWLGINIRTNRFAAQDIAAMLPQASRYQTSGLIQASLQGESPSGSPTDLGWKGTVALAGFSFKPTEKVKTVSAINGTVTFKGTTLESSHLSVNLGSSTIQGRGSLAGFTKPTIRLSFSTPLLDPADLGLRVPQAGFKIARMAGSITLKDNSLQIAGLSGQVNNSILSLKGTVQDLDNPNIDLTLLAPRLVVEDLLLLTALEQEKPSPGPAPQVTLKATVRVDSGTALDIPFEQLKGVVMLENKILYLQPLEASLAGGKLSGTARIDLGTSGPERRLQTSYKLENASAERLLRALDVKKQEVKGTVFLQGELTAKGETGTDIKRTALGSARLRIEDGSLRRFSTLSKIFSILNVSQLLKFQLPDMVSGGMPFNEITGSFAIKDGVISTNDLYVDSDAINLTLIGSVNLAKNEINATIGAKPLQTIDKVVSRIPIVGWILTGKDRSLITAYFEAKGKLDDPSVNAIPVKAMTKGVFEIFRRIFELPARLVTDTGEVIVGK